MALHKLWIADLVELSRYRSELVITACCWRWTPRNKSGWAMTVSGGLS